MDRCFAAAQVHSLLALVEQQRIANLIALGSVERGVLVLSQQPAFDARSTLVEYREHDDPDLGGWLELRPEIKTALNIKEPNND